MVSKFVILIFTNHPYISQSPQKWINAAITGQLPRLAVPTLSQCINTENASKNPGRANQNLNSSLLTLRLLSRSSARFKCTIYTAASSQRALRCASKPRQVRPRSTLCPFSRWGGCRSPVQPLWCVPLTAEGEANKALVCSSNGQRQGFWGCGLAKVNTRRASRGSPPPLHPSEQS